MKNYKLFKFIFNCTLAILLLFIADLLVEQESLKYFIGALITMYGLEKVLVLVFTDKDFTQHNDFYRGCIELLLGICTLLFFTTYESICVIWAVWAIFREVEEIKKIICDEKVKVVKCLSFVESIIAIVFSILLIIEVEEHHALTHVYLLSVELFTAVVFPQISLYFEKKLEKK